MYIYLFSKETLHYDLLLNVWIISFLGKVYHYSQFGLTSVLHILLWVILQNNSYKLQNWRKTSKQIELATILVVTDLLRFNDIICDLCEEGLWKIFLTWQGTSKYNPPCIEMPHFHNLNCFLFLFFHSLSSLYYSFKVCFSSKATYILSLLPRSL